MHRGNTLKVIARKTRIRAIASLVILNAHAQDKIINNDPVLNRKLMGQFMDESIHNLAVMAGMGSVASGKTIIDTGKVVVID